MTSAEMISPDPENIGDAEPHWLERQLEAMVMRKLGHSASRAFWMLGDQGVVSLGNFFTVNILARHFPNNWQIGAFTLMMESMFFLNSLQAAVVNYPLTIQGASGSKRGMRLSASAALLFTLIILPVLGGGMAFAAWRAVKNGNATLPESTVMLAIAGTAAMALWQMQEAMRRGLISEFRMLACIPGDAISYLGQASAVYALYYFHQLTMVNAFYAIAVTSAVAMALQAMQMGATRIRLKQLMDLGAEWWRLGKWMLLANLSTAITGISFWYMLDFTHKADESVFAIITQPLKLTNPVLTSIGGLLIPAVARAAASGNRSKVRRSALMYAGMGAAVLGPAYLFLICFPHISLHIFFGSRYDNDLRLQQLLQLWTINWIVSYVTMVLNSWLAGLKQARYRFLAETLHMIVAVGISLPATAIWGVKGLILGGLITTCIDTAALIYFMIKADRDMVALPPQPEPIPQPAV